MNSYPSATLKTTISLKWFKGLYLRDQIAAHFTTADLMGMLIHFTKGLDVLH